MENLRPKTPPKPRRKLLLAVVVIVIVAVILLTPPILAGGLTVPVSTVTFGETTGSLAATKANVTVQTMTAYQYLFTVRAGGMVRTSDTDVSSSRGIANITIMLELTNPSGKTVDLGNTSIKGGIGTRTHTIYLSVDQGVRAPGTYSLEIVIKADVVPVGLIAIELTTSVPTSFTIS